MQKYFLHSVADMFQIHFFYSTFHEERAKKTEYVHLWIEWHLWGLPLPELAILCSSDQSGMILDEWISLELNKKWIKKVSICIKKIAHIKNFHTLRGINKTFITVWAVVCFLWLSGMLEWCHKIWSRCFHCFYKISSFWIFSTSLLFFLK